MTTVATKPIYAVPNKRTFLSFTLTESGTNFLRVWVTDAPAGSDWKRELEEKNSSREVIYTGDASQPLEVKFDRGGCYRLLAQEYTQAAANFGGSYEDDPDAAASETKVGNETSLTVYIGQRMTSTMGYGNDTATLVLYVWNENVRSTTLETHGEASPAIIQPSSIRAEAAASESAVQTQLRTVGAGGAATVVIGTLKTLLSAIITKYNAHLSQGGVHDTNDSDNAVDAAYVSDVTAESLPEAINSVLLKMRQHMQNDDGEGPGTAASAYHDVSGAKFDQANLPLFQAVGSVEEAYRAMGDIWRAYNDHRVSTDVHDAADTTNVITNNSPLVYLHSLFFEVLAASSPTVPDTQSSAAMLLMSQTGAEETTLEP